MDALTSADKSAALNVHRGNLLKAMAKQGLSDETADLYVSAAGVLANWTLKEHVDAFVGAVQDYICGTDVYNKDVDAYTKDTVGAAVAAIDALAKAANTASFLAGGTILDEFVATVLSKKYDLDQRNSELNQMTPACMPQKPTKMSKKTRRMSKMRPRLQR